MPPQGTVLGNNFLPWVTVNGTSTPPWWLASEQVILRTQKLGKVFIASCLLCACCLPSQSKIPGRADRGRHGWGPEEGELATAYWVCIAAFTHSPERPLPTPPTPPTPRTCCSPQDVYSLSKCVVPLPATIMRRIGVPLPAELVQMEEQGVGWEEFQVRQSSQLLRTGC